MHEPRRPGSTAPPARQEWRPSAIYLVLALVVALGVPVAWLMPSSPTKPVSADAAPASMRAASADRTDAAAKARESPPAALPIAAAAVRTSVAGPTQTAAPQIPRQRDPDGDQTPDLADYVNPGEKPTMAEVIDRLHAAGVTTGLGAFQPPGTRPPLIGIAVPEDFQLPEGYVRHHQATDDGQRIEPILMFSPDHQWFDAAGRPVVLPPDRVVPAHLAPPGLPIRRVVVPAPTEPGK